jgi:hypothetical protein
MMPTEVKSIYKGAVWLRDSDEIIHRGLLRLGKGSSGQILSRSILNHYIIQASFSHYPLILHRAVWKRRIILARVDGAAGSVCQDFLFFRPMEKKVTHRRKKYFLRKYKPKKVGIPHSAIGFCPRHISLLPHRSDFCCLCLFASFLINVFYVLEYLLRLLTMASYGNFPSTILYPFLKFLM